MLDLDGFKAINDTHGHRTGDEVLKAVAGAIRHRLRSTDIVARLGGDEFAILLPNVNVAKAAAVAEDVRRCVAAVKVIVGGGTLSPHASIGAGAIDHRSRSNEAIMIEADRAMYADKRARRYGDAPA
jgi:diguanylate cyclase (GGDEF)-like protein